jgi:DNA-binding IclR family transcriptional regulator
LIADKQDYLAEPGLVRRQGYAVDEETGLPGGGCLW